eukprot:4698934-Pleurochrysis_carterae.AAC.3
MESSPNETRSIFCRQCGRNVRSHSEARLSSLNARASSRRSMKACSRRSAAAFDEAAAGGSRASSCALAAASVSASHAVFDTSSPFAVMYASICSRLSPFKWFASSHRSVHRAITGRMCEWYHSALRRTKWGERWSARSS